MEGLGTRGISVIYHLRESGWVGRFLGVHDFQGGTEGRSVFTNIVERGGLQKLTENVGGGVIRIQQNFRGGSDKFIAIEQNPLSTLRR